MSLPLFPDDPPIESDKPFPFGIPGAVEPPRFNGPVYEPEHDQRRLTGQILRVFDCMKDGEWRTLYEIAGITGDPQASISAQLRHLRKERFGSHVVEKRSRGERESGLWEYKLSM